MSNTGSKFGMLRSLNQATSEDPRSEKQNSVIPEKQDNALGENRLDTSSTTQPPISNPVSKNTKAEKQDVDKAEKQNTTHASEQVDRYHYSSYMPSNLYARLQLYVAKRKAARGKTGEKVSLQSVITEALEQYLQQHDR